MSRPSPLTRRPQATAFSIEELLDFAQRGDVRVPEFQRAFQWKASDIRELFDSVYHGYPIGTLLFWKREGPAATIRLGPVQIDAPQTAQALWVVDGQQRITALAGVLLHPENASNHESAKYSLFFDLDKEDFVRLSGRSHPPAHWLPLNIVLDTEKLLNWLDRYPSRTAHPEHTKSAMRLGKILREYQVPAYIVEADEEETLRVIFDRLNSTGRSLRQADVFHALHGGLQKTTPSGLRDLAHHLRDMDFGPIDEQWILKSVLALKGRDITKDFRQQLKDEQDLAETLQRTDKAIRNVIIFLKRDASIPHIELLPYKLPLALLARFFDFTPEPSSRSRDLLSRWLWRGAITEHHRGDNIPAVRKSLMSITRDEEQSVQDLLATLPTKPDIAVNIQDYNFRTAQTKLQTNALLALAPKHLLDGHTLNIHLLINELGAASFTPIITSTTQPLHHTHLESPKASNKPSLHGLANRIFHTHTEKNSLVRALQAATPSVLQSHGIPPSAIKSLQQQDNIGFLKHRGEFLRKHIGAFLDSRARWLEPNRKSIHSLIISDEED